ncbi:DUF2797 domain-containing protein [Microlunatus parietis]|uniref:DUF2797 domain-containing protein n=1 Tax=Microlunatus parietis TaxID=682979 RepID=A0A7Y9I3F3_9ACTN|nr:DUF2797 domain-containing protein [Microlunatus parietis]NYE69521.1 hypothetical protein [Microlunatus parietis]
MATDRRVLGTGWSAAGAQLNWSDETSSPLPLGADLALTVGADRRCVGFWRRDRHIPCPTRSELPASARGPVCPECQTLDRWDSVAADTRLDDPREFSVYLAHHGTKIKIGITATERGRARLLEQGALASMIISAGPLLSARRVEHLVSTALGYPDRISSVIKYEARTRPGTAADRARELLAAADRAAALDWPGGQVRTADPEIVDHCSAYGLPDSGLQPRAALLPLVPGAVLAGRLDCAIGADLYLGTDRGLTMIDSRLLAGWPLDPAPAGAAFTAPVRAVEPPPEDTQEALF